MLNSWYDYGVYDKLGIFLFEIEPTSADVDRMVWIIIGDLPSAYLDASIKSGKEAMIAYIEIMEAWALAVLKNKPLAEYYSVEAPPTHENANLLLQRLNFIRNKILPNYL